MTAGPPRGFLAPWLFFALKPGPWIGHPRTNLRERFAPEDRAPVVIGRAKLMVPYLIHARRCGESLLKRVLAFYRSSK